MTWFKRMRRYGHTTAGEDDDNGATDASMKSFELLPVAVQPLLNRMIDVVADGEGAAGLPD